MKMSTVLSALLMVLVIFPSTAAEENKALLKLTKDLPNAKNQNNSMTLRSNTLIQRI